MSYNTAAIRDLLKAVFNDEELTAFCFDHFRPVHDNFTIGMGRLVKIQCLIEHCDKSKCFDKLLTIVKDINPTQFKKFEDKIKASTPIPPSSSSKKSQVEIMLKGDLADITPGLQFALVGALVGILDISRDQIRVFEVYDGSIVLRLEMPKEAADQLIALYQKNDPVIRDLGIQQVRLDFTFQNRDELIEDILECRANHIELYGPCGVGKTYLLKHITGNRQDIHAVYIELNGHSKIEEILREVIGQLGGQTSETPASVEKMITRLAVAINNLHHADPPVNQFLFLFDSVTEKHQEVVDWLIGRDGLLNSRRLLDTLRTVDIEIGNLKKSRDVKLQVIIAARRPIVRVENYHSNLRFERFPIDRLVKHPDQKQDPVQLMLKELAKNRKFPIAPGPSREISDKVHYLTGGHPKCARSMLFAVADTGFVPTQEEWRSFFESHVLPTIEKEILGSLPEELLPVFQVLSVFRRFDQRLLGTLLERQALPILVGTRDVSRQARQLRKRLVGTYLISEPAIGESMYVMNFTVRRVLSLSMQYHSPERYQAINNVALDVFTEWLQSAQVGGSRSVIILIEIVYHWFKALEMDPKVTPEDICARIRDVLKKHLSLLLEAIDEEDWPNYLPLLRAHWRADEELQETAQRATGESRYYEILSREIDRFVSDNV
jgi:hypothetical protein